MAAAGYVREERLSKINIKSTYEDDLLSSQLMKTIYYQLNLWRRSIIKPTYEDDLLSFTEEVVRDSPLWPLGDPKCFWADNEEKSPIEPPSAPLFTWILDGF